MKPLIIISFFLLSIFYSFSQVPNQVELIEDFDEMENVSPESEEIFNWLKVMPEFPSGEDSMLSFVSSNFKVVGADDDYRFWVFFIVEKDGSVTNVQIPPNVKNLPKRISDEAIRVVSLFPRFKPGMIKGFPVRCRMLVPFRVKGNFDDFMGTVKELCSDKYKGRGYVEGDDKKAADYLVSVYKEIGLKGYDSTYLQPFPITVSTFPQKITLAMNGDTLVTGRDYIVDPHSPSLSGEYKVWHVKNLKALRPKKIQKAVAKNQVICMSHTDYKELAKLQSMTLLQGILRAPALLLYSDQKFTQSMAQGRHRLPIFTIKPPKTKIKSVSIDLKTRLLNNYESNNVIGYLEGEVKDTFIVIGGHYDHLGRMGEVYFPGANDNASGVATMIELAKYFVKNPPKYSLAFIAFSGEEVGLIGSKYYCEHPIIPLAQTKMNLTLDLFGAGKDGITVVNATEYPQQFDLLRAVNKEEGFLPQIKSRGPSANSDHHFFHVKGVPAFFFYTLGDLTAYHDIYDTPESMESEAEQAFENVYSLLVAYIKAL